MPLSSGYKSPACYCLVNIIGIYRSLFTSNTPYKTFNHLIPILSLNILFFKNQIKIVKVTHPELLNFFFSIQKGKIKVTLFIPIILLPEITINISRNVVANANINILKLPFKKHTCTQAQNYIIHIIRIILLLASPPIYHYISDIFLCLYRFATLFQRSSQCFIL